MDVDRHHGQYGEVRIDPTGVGGAEGVSEVQTVTLTGTPAGGSFTLLFDAEETIAIAFNAPAAVVQTALLALPSFRAGDVVVTGPAGGPYVLTYGADFSQEDVAALTADDAGLTGGTTPAVVIATTTPGSAGAIVLVEDMTGWSYSSKKDRQDVTCLGDRNKKKVLGLPDISGSMGAIFASNNPVIFDCADGTIAPLLRLVPNRNEPEHYFHGTAYMDASVKLDAKGIVAVDSTWDAAGDWERQ